MMLSVNDFKSNAENQWCPGCPNFGILSALRQAFLKLQKRPEEICLVSGIGQAAKFPHYFRSNFFNGLHGRAIPVAVGIQIANPTLKTVVVTGDGDCYGEGGNHFLHNIRRNPDITLIVHNNQIYGLTKGQASPTTELGEKTRLQFDGVELEPLSPVMIGLIHGCGFIARGFAGDIPHLTELMIEALDYRGFSYIDIIQPCISWGTHSVEWYKERITRISEDYDPSNWEEASKKAREWGEQIPIGIIYRNTEKRACFGDHFRESVWKGKLTDLKSQPDEVIRDFITHLKV